MSKILPLLLLILTGACALEEEPAPDPVRVERLLLRLEADRLDRAEALLSDKQREKLNRAERMVAPLEKLPAEKINPSLAEALIAG